MTTPDYRSKIKIKNKKIQSSFFLFSSVLFPNCNTRCEVYVSVGSYVRERKKKKASRICYVRFAVFIFLARPPPFTTQTIIVTSLVAVLLTDTGRRPVEMITTRYNNP